MMVLKCYSRELSTPLGDPVLMVRQGVMTQAGREAVEPPAERGVWAQVLHQGLDRKCDQLVY